MEEDRIDDTLQFIRQLNRFEDWISGRQDYQYGVHCKASIADPAHGFGGDFVLTGIVKD